MKTCTLSINEINNEKLYNWNAPTVRPEIEETEDQILAAIEYEDHGDIFVVIKTIDDKCFKYGWFLNRYGFPDYKELDNANYWGFTKFIRKPKLDEIEKKPKKEWFEFYYENDEDPIDNKRTGSSGKYEIDGSGKIYGDDVCKIWINPKYTNRKKVYLGYGGTDKFGYDSFALNLNLIKKDK